MYIHKSKIQLSHAQNTAKAAKFHTSKEALYSTVSVIMINWDR